MLTHGRDDLYPTFYASLCAMCVCAAFCCISSTQAALSPEFPCSLGSFSIRFRSIPTIQTRGPFLPQEIRKTRWFCNIATELTASSMVFPGIKSDFIPGPWPLFLNTQAACTRLSNNLLFENLRHNTRADSFPAFTNCESNILCHCDRFSKRD
jgi:hypothetical protein